MGKTKSRGNGEGTIYQRPDGRWCAQTTVGGKRRTFYGRTRKEVAEKLSTELAESQKGMVRPVARVTVKEHLERWLEDIIQPRRRTSTHRLYSQLARLYLLPAFGSVKLRDLQPAHLQRLYADMTRRGLSANTVRRTHGVIRGALGHALNTGLVARNVASVAHPPTLGRSEVQVLDALQVRRLMAAASGTRWEVLIRTAINSQMREGELLGLRWSEVDLDRGTIRIVRQQGTDGSIGEPKTEAGRRTIELPAHAVTALREHRASQLEERLMWGPEWEDNDLVFCSHRGRPLSHQGALRALKVLLKKAELPDITFHALRHTGATLLLSQGEHIKVVAERLGHADELVTIRTYAHVLPHMRTAAADKLEKLLG